MRLVAGLLIAVLAAACSGRSTSGPAWPKSSEKELDGGESLAPHVASSVAPPEEAKEPVVEEKPAEKPEEKPATPEVKPATPATPPPVAEQPVTTEEIVIEVED